jgi:hypothetical protein
VQVISFKDAIEDSNSFSKRHLLLGNGFSIACRPDIFHYGSLFDQANFTSVPEVEDVFEALGTQDFEIAIRALENAAKLLPIYVSGSGASAAKMKEHAAALKDILISTVAGNHPVAPYDIDEGEIWACRKFLAYFLSEGGRGGHVFTLNYDLLLYWVLMNEGNPFISNPVKLNRGDSFGNDEDIPEAEYVVWQGETAAYKANIFYLHGALHLFDSGAELQKYTWIRSGDRLVDQARRAIEEDKFPLFVAEGSSSQKKNKIRHNAYLYQGFKTFTANAQTGTHCFFIFGHSLAKNDDHILNRLGRGKFKRLYVGLYGDPGSDENKKIVARALGLSAMRHVRFPLDVVFYDAESAMVWG